MTTERDQHDGLWDDAPQAPTNEIEEKIDHLAARIYEQAYPFRTWGDASPWAQEQCRREAVETLEADEAVGTQRASPRQPERPRGSWLRALRKHVRHFLNPF